MFLFDVASDLVIKRNQKEVELCILIFFWGISSLFLLYVSPDVTVSPWARLKRSAALSHPPSLNLTTGHLLCSHVSSCSTAEREEERRTFRLSGCSRWIGWPGRHSCWPVSGPRQEGSAVWPTWKLQGKERTSAPSPSCLNLKADHKEKH